MSIGCWVPYEIIRVGDPRWLNVTGDCMTGDLVIGFNKDDAYGDGYGEDGSFSNYPAALAFG